MKANARLLLGVLCALAWPVSVLAAPTPAPLQPRVDERVELLTIAYLLAFPNQPGAALNATYARAVHQHFDPFASHAFVEYIRELAKTAAQDGNDLGAWEIPSVALHLGPAPKFEPLVAVRHEGAADEGWDDRTLLTPKFLSLLRSFCAAARCESFLSEQQTYYQKVDEAYEKHGTKIDQGWFIKFFSVAPTETYSPIIVLLGMGGGDYIRVNFPGYRRNTHTLFASGSFDKSGIPTDLENPGIRRANLHEYAHAFANQLVDKNLAQLQPAAETILGDKKVLAKMKDTFYGNAKFLLYESMVRACVIAYLLERGEPGSGEEELKAQEKAGFFWMAGLVELLTSYGRERQTYGDLSQFMPKIITYFADTAQRFESGKFAFPGE